MSDMRTESRWERRERKLRKRRSLDMVVSNRSIKTVILQQIGKKPNKIGKKEQDATRLREP